MASKGVLRTSAQVWPASHQGPEVALVGQRGAVARVAPHAAAALRRPRRLREHLRRHRELVFRVSGVRVLVLVMWTMHSICVGRNPLWEAISSARSMLSTLGGCCTCVCVCLLLKSRYAVLFTVAANCPANKLHERCATD